MAYWLLALNRNMVNSVLFRQFHLRFLIPDTNYSLHSFQKDNTSPEIFRHNFYELCLEYKHFKRFYTDGCKMDDKVASAVVWQNSKTARLPNKTSIFRAELFAIVLSLDIVCCRKEKDFIFLTTCQAYRPSMDLNLSWISCRKLLKTVQGSQILGRELSCVGFQAIFQSYFSVSSLKD